MFEDFLFKNYLRTDNKLKKTRKLINRIYGDYKNKSFRFEKLENSLKNLEKVFKSLEQLEEVTVTDLPDLIVQSIIPTYHDHYISFAITVKNQGTQPADPSTLNVIIESINEDLSIGILAAGESQTVNLVFAFDPSGDSQIYNALATADAGNVIEETDETNNTRDRSVSAKSQYTPSEGKAYVIVHCHSPEGKEIGSITGASTPSIERNGVPIGTGATDEASHAIPISIDPGVVTISSIFNGMTKSTSITIVEGETRQIIFTFSRTTQELNWGGSASLSLDSYEDIGVKTDDSCIFSFVIVPQVSTPPLPYRYATADYNFTRTSYTATVTCGAGHNDGRFVIARIGVYSVAESKNYAKPINIPINSSFINWYSQYDRTNGYPGIYVLSSDKSVDQPLIYSGLTGTHLLPASISYKHIRFNTVLEVRTLIGALSETISATLNYLYISSVPYDLDGLAV